MTVEDTLAVGAIHVRAWQAAYAGIMPAEYLDRLRADDRAEMWRSLIEAERPGTDRSVIEAEGELVGFAAYGPEHSTVDDSGVGELYAINIDPAQWRHGLGRALLCHVTEQLTRLGYGCAVLWIVSENERARRFYEAEGWHFDGTEKVDDALGAVVNECRYAVDLPRPNEPDHR